MNYKEWREDIFGKEPDSDPVMAELLNETYDLSGENTLEYIDLALIDADIHSLYSKEQIGIGLQILYSNACSDIPFSYIQASDYSKMVKSISNLNYLYSNYFEKYCLSPVSRVGYDLEDGAIGFLCYMLWDIFVLYPGNASQEMIDAAIGVMKNAVNSSNDHCIVSALHGLGHWASDAPSAIEIIEKWLHNPTTENRVIIQYANDAKTGCIQ